MIAALLDCQHRAARSGPRAAKVAGEKRSLRADIAEGVRWLRHHRLLRTLALVLGALNFAAWLGMATAVLFAQEILGLDEAGFGLLLAGMAVGSVLGGLFGATGSRPRSGPAERSIVTSSRHAASPRRRSA